MSRILRRGQGFTLLELMIVIAIMGILASILVPNMVRSRNQAKLSACKQHIRSLASAIETYATDGGGRYPTDMADLTPEYIKVLPTCPQAQSSAPYLTGYENSTSPDNYTIMCKGDQHTGVGLSPDFPQYNASNGLSDY